MPDQAIDALFFVGGAIAALIVRHRLRVLLGPVKQKGKASLEAVDKERGDSDGK